jgi:hypothetical protein
MPRGSETAKPMVLEPTSSPRIRGWSENAIESSEGTWELYEDLIV